MSIRAMPKKSSLCVTSLSKTSMAMPPLLASQGTRQGTTPLSSTSCMRG